MQMANNFYGYETKAVIVENAITLGDGLGSFLLANLPQNAHAICFNDTVFGSDSIEDRHFISAEVTTVNGSISDGYFVRKNNNSQYVAYLQFTNTYAVKASVGDKIIFIYKTL